jgi:hypothetical protein
MNTQKLFSVLFTAFLLVALTGLVSAATSFTASGPGTLTQSANTTTFTITANENVTLTLPSTVSLGNATVSVSPNGAITMNASQTRTITLTTIAFPTNMGTYSGSLVITNATATDNQTVTVNYNKGYCEYGSVARNASRYLEITSIKDSSSDDDWKWQPLDKVTVDVKVKFINNDDDDDSIDAIVNLGLYDTQNDEFIELGSGDDNLEESVSLDEGKSSTVSFNVEVPVDIEDSNGRYRLYVKVYEDGEEDSVCRDYTGSDSYRDIDMQKNSYDIALKDITATEDVPCGQEARVTVNAYNVGTHDEDKIYVTLSNTALGIDLNSSTFSIDEGDTDPYKITFTFNVPKNATEKTYKLSLYSFFRYSDSSDVYKEQSDEFTVDLRVQGSCSTSASNTANITSVVLSDQTPKAVIGSQVIVEATIKNTGTLAASYTVDVAGNSQWSNAATIDPKTFTLNAGDSRKVNIYLDIANNATIGEKEFTIQAVSGSATAEQKVKLTLEKGITSSSIINHIKANWIIYTIILVNLILIIAIILVVKSIVSSKN